jgi:endonuclease
VSGSAVTVPAVRLLVARCDVRYTGRLAAFLPEATRLVILKGDGSVLVHADSGGYKPLNWMTAPTVVDVQGEPPRAITVRKAAGAVEDRLEIRVASVLSDVTHELGVEAGLEKDGVERDLQQELAARPEVLEHGLRLVCREWPTDIGPLDLMCRAADGSWVAVEVKRLATLDAVEQLSRYLERIRLDPAKSSCRGIVAGERVRPQAARLALARGLACVEVELDVLRGEREPDLTLFTA